MVTLGIDLGTTFSGAATIVGSTVKHISHPSGRKFLESVVRFCGNTYFIGELDAEIHETYKEGVVFDSKRMIGRTLTDPEVQHFIGKWPFQVNEDEQGIKVTVTEGGNTHCFTPAQISGMILHRLKILAEEQVGQAITRTVVSIPARFNHRQRDATLEACTYAQLPNCTLLNEPTAAAIEYDQHHEIPVGSLILVYDLGGGTFDLSIVEKTVSGLEVRHIEGDMMLGGRDFDNNLVELVRQRFRKAHNVDLPDDSLTKYNLMKICTQAKLRLSSETVTNIILSNVVDDKSLNERITRADFERCNRKLFERTIQMIDKLFQRTGLSKNKIHSVVVVGGSTRIPRIRELLSEYFGEEKISYNMHPDQAIVEGAARYAAFLAAEQDGQAPNYVVRTVSSMDLGVEAANGDMVVFIKRETEIPVERKHYATNDKSGEKEVIINVYEGNEPKARDNLLIGRFVMGNLPKVPVGSLLLRITFRYTIDCIVKVTAVCIQNGQEQAISINLPDERKRAANEAERQRQFGLNIPGTRNTGNFDPLLQNLRDLINVFMNSEEHSTNEPLMLACKSAQQWLKGTPVFTVFEVMGKIREIYSAAKQVYDTFN